MLIILGVACIPLTAQNLSISFSDKALNQALQEIQAAYSIDLSFDDKALSKYTVSYYGSFNNAGELLEELLKELPYTYVWVSGTYIIYPSQPETPSQTTYKLNARVVDKFSLESIPFAYVWINGSSRETDLNGLFATETNDSIFQVKVSYLGYYVLDTIITGSKRHVLPLTPSIVDLSEVVVQDQLINQDLQIGFMAGRSKLNQQIGSFLPGHGDNSVFNLLRLQPGILAAGEQSTELIIWGAYEGQSRIGMDGFTVYGLKNFNDNISSFNPQVVKDIEILKGGFDARYGDRVGGLVNLTSVNGRRDRPHFSAYLNNMTFNFMGELPTGKKSSLWLAFRNTYYNLYNPLDISINNQQNPNNASVNLSLQPDYVFRDFNIKYTVHPRENDLFFISLYAGMDNYGYDIDEPFRNDSISFSYRNETLEKSGQFGGSAFYSRVWNDAYISDFSLSVSAYRSDFQLNEWLHLPVIDFDFPLENLKAQNQLNEVTFRWDNRFTIHPKHLLETGLYLQTHEFKLVEDTFGVAQAYAVGQSSRIGFYIQDVLTLGKKAMLRLGSRFTYAAGPELLYPEPRVSLSLPFGRGFRMNMAWGLYNQFVVKSSLVDGNGNYRYLWTIADNEDIPVLAAVHWVGGMAFSRNNWLLSLEAYFKTTQGLTRYIRSFRFDFQDIFLGRSKSAGMDFFVQYNFGRHKAWVSYSLGQTLEHFDYMRPDHYERAFHDQTHELKSALMINMEPFYFSCNYVYGSGFPRDPFYQPNKDIPKRYSRLDVSIIYKFLDQKLKGEGGISVLNVLNTQNFKYTSFNPIPLSQLNQINLYTESIPITPAIYLRFHI